jgi:hypothetical protein
MNQESQGRFASPALRQPYPPPRGLIIPNPKLKLLDQVREVMRLKHYAIRTEQCYCDWIRRYIHFHRLRAREELLAEPEAKMELFLSDLAVQGQVAASTQNQLAAAIPGRLPGGAAGGEAGRGREGGEAGRQQVVDRMAGGQASKRSKGVADLVRSNSG